MLEQTNQVDKIIQYNWVYIQKRKIALWFSGLFIMWVISNSTLTSEEAKELCSKEWAIFLQQEDINYTWAVDALIQGFVQWYYKKFITPFTALIDLTRTKEVILADMKPKWRYNIRLAEKKWIAAEIVEKNDQNIQSFSRLSQETTARDKFAGHSFEYYKRFLELLPSSQLILAKTEWKVIAGGIFIFNSDVSIYYYGASSSEKQYRNLMAPYAVQWTAIQHAKKIDSKLYDFLGVSGTWIYEDESLRGVTDFKMKLTKKIVHVSNSSIFIYKKILFYSILLLKKIKRS